MERGILLYAHNNGSVDYMLMAFECARRIRNHLGRDIPITLVTDEESAKHSVWRNSTLPNVNVAVIPMDRDIDNWRTYFGSPGEEAEVGRYYNRTRSSAYDLSPYDETLVIDVDYVLQTNRLNRVWGSYSSVMVPKKIESITDYSNRKYIERIGPLGIPHYWATVFYFRKDDVARMFFDLVHHVEKYYSYYGTMYGFRGSSIRNDYTFSVAAHIMSDYHEPSHIDQLPIGSLLFAWDKDVVVQVSDGEIQFECIQGGKRLPVRIAGQDVHILNKKSWISHIKGDYDSVE